MALFKRKDKDGKRKGENAIGKIIYGFLLFMPLIAVGVACLYAILNKNAYQSYSDSTIQKLLKVENNDSLVVNGTYSIYLSNTNTNYTSQIYYSETNIDWNYVTNSTLSYTVKGFRTNQLDSNPYIWLYDENSTSHQYALINFDISYFNEKYIIYESGNLYSAGQPLAFYLQISVQNKLDNMFYYQLGKLEESDLFNWTKNTGAYTVMHNVTEGIGITNTYTPMLMTYWLLISVIYFIFDIALILVWAVHDKIHELKDAI